MLKLQEFYSIIILIKYKTQKSVTDKITSNNLNSMGFNRFFYCVQHLAYCLFMDTL
jgi:hypothetical protein